MCQANTHQHSINCVVPSYLLRAIALRGTQEQREIALRTYSISHTLRTMRVTETLLTTKSIVTPLGVSLQVGTPPRVHRTICDTHNSAILPGDVVRVEGQGPTNDPAVNEAYDAIGSIFDFYLKVYQRNSIDNRGGPILGTVHYGNNVDNAFWNGRQMLFGDGDGFFFKRFTLSLDVIGHELTHGVIQYEAGLGPQNQPGALNESIADVFGSLVKQYVLKQTADQADWLIGAGLFTENVQGTALRSLRQPGSAFNDPVLNKDPQPAHMRDFVFTLEDNGGIHINSGIPNHAFYLAATKIGGYAWEKAGRIWYNALRDARLQPDSDFQSFAQLTALTADQLYGQGSTEGQAVREAWNEVGIALLPVAVPVAAAGLGNGQEVAKKQRAKDALDILRDVLDLG